eukprot:m.1374109 g.1374109  ORF g.1374109 m.1374109 type:complete len:67 (+) comp24958_c0_seq26:246-446(+)
MCRHTPCTYTHTQCTPQSHTRIRFIHKFMYTVSGTPATANLWFAIGTRKRVSSVSSLAAPSSTHSS